jgi:hypothetical protein
LGKIGGNQQAKQKKEKGKLKYNKIIKLNQIK